MAPLIGLMIVLAGVIGWELLAPPMAGPAAPVHGRPAVVAAAGPSWGVTAEETAALLSRPPFSPSRRPDPLDGAALAGLPVLSGILVAQADRRAIFSGADGKRPAVVQVGDQIGAYRVEAISPMNVTLDGPDGRRTITPAFSTAPPPPRALPSGLPQGFAAPPPPSLPAAPR